MAQFGGRGKKSGFFDLGEKGEEEVQEMEEFYAIEEKIEAGEINEEYEFDAPMFYDFTRSETDSEVAEAELWFQSAGSCPPSPFAIKLKQRILSIEVCGNTDSGDESEISQELEVSAMDYDERESCSMEDEDDDIAKTKSRSQAKASLWRSSTLMKPTASYLAKHNQYLEVQSRQYLRRVEKLLSVIDDKSSKCSSLVDNNATKRQKLEAGYRSKVAHMKHQVSFVHKTPKKERVSDARNRVTVPKEPELETARRAQQRSSKVKAEPKQDTKLDVRFFKAQPLNRKILEAPPLPKRSTPRVTQVQEFHFRTSERARQNALNKETKLPNYISTSRSEVTDSRRLNSSNVLKEERNDGGHRKKLSGKGGSDVFWNVPMGFKVPAGTRILEEPPTELFNQLSLASNVQPDMKSQSRKPLACNKVSKENIPGSVLLQHKAMDVEKEKLSKKGEKQARGRSVRGKETRPRFSR